jgi:hypothetical protein
MRKGLYKVVKVNIDEEPQLAQEYGVQSIPMIGLVRNGRLERASVGAKARPQLEAEGGALEQPGHTDGGQHGQPLERLQAVTSADVRGARLVVPAERVHESVEHVKGHRTAKEALDPDQLLPVFDELFKTPAKFILNRHEQASGHCADGYARATGKPGVCIVTSGPGTPASGLLLSRPS